MAIFREFFGGDNPFHGLFPPVDEFGVVKEIAPRTRKIQNPPLEKDLKITLEEAFLGCVKKMRVQRQVMNDDGHTNMVREKILTIHVASGWKRGCVGSTARF
jgi:DnaJ family protein B protein 13